MLPRLTALDRIIEVLGWISLMGFWLLFAYYYPSLPDTIPTHFDGSGNVDRYGGKAMAWMLPGIATLLFWGLTALSRHPYLYNYPVPLTPDNILKQYRTAIRMMRMLKLILVGVFGLVFYQTVLVAVNASAQLGAWVLPVILTALFGTVFAFLISASRNS